ncbi:MAG: GntR family transcriptional regulator [Dethiobacter sp.]|jgi:GntR family transcriptional regulator|nr:MAG: GntR family transcriptional regulator [Dethiobacter sp.]
MVKSWFHLNPHSGIPMYLQLKEQIKTAVAGGALHPGDRLPPVRELALTLTVNPNTVARAYSELEREGILSAEQGRGTFVSGGEPLLREEERRVQVQSLIDKVLVEAFNLRITGDQLQAIWEERLRAWEKRLQR